MDITNHLKAGFPMLYILTPEESRAELQITKTAEKCGRASYFWSITTGFFQVNGKWKDEDMKDPVAALNYILTEAKKPKKTKDSGGNPRCVYIFRDFHPYFDNPVVRRLIRDIAFVFKQVGDVLIIISPISKIPDDIVRDFTLIEFVLPKYEDIARIWDLLYEQNMKGKIKISEDEREQIIQGAMGLTTTEAEAAFSKAIIDRKEMDLPEDKKPSIGRLVLKEKAQAVKKTGVLEYFEATQGMDDIGGLDILKQFFKVRGKAFTKKAKDFGLPPPRGIVLCGLPGTGKSLSAKAASNILNIPLIRFDIGRCFGGIIGQSETNMRNALNTIDAIGSAVIWLDEMEKAFAGTGGSGNNDSGVTKRIFSQFLNWMQEKKTPSFCIATVNKIDHILIDSPELLRKGRFDEIFFVGLPTNKERAQILNIHIKRLWRGTKPPKVDLDEVASKADKFSGAELEEAVITAIYQAFYLDDNKDTCELKTEHLVDAVKNTNPLARSAAPQLEAMAKWAKDNAVPASTPEKSDGIKFSRHLDLGN